MAAKQKRLTIEQEEVLAFNVKNYPCLFDKKDKGYKEKDCVANAWKEVSNSIEFSENGKSLIPLVSLHKKSCLKVCFSLHNGKKVSDFSYVLINKQRMI